MEREEYLAKCLEIAKRANSKLQDVASDKATEFAWIVSNYGEQEGATKEALTKSIADMHICLMSISCLFAIDGLEVEAYVAQQLGLD